MTGRFCIPLLDNACFGRILEPMLVELVEVAVRPASADQRENGVDEAFELFRFGFMS
jgi:hypothetical protein